MISIIIPMYNSEKYIRSCIDSILNQTFNNFELLIIDDGSTDNSYNICKSYNDKRIRLFKLNHKGVSYARNYGLKKAVGDYISFIDSDDIIDKDYYNIIYKLLIKYDASFVEVDIKPFEDSLKNNYKKKLKYKTINKFEMFNRLYGKNGVRTCLVINKLFKRYLFDSIKFEDVPNEDEFIIHKLIDKSDNIVIINNFFYYYRVHFGSRQRSFDSSRLYLLHVFDDREKYIDDHSLFKKNSKLRLDMIIYLFCVCKKYNMKKEMKYLLKQFAKYYSLNYGLYHNIKYLLFKNYPDFLSSVMLKKKRYKYV